MTRSNRVPADPDRDGTAIVIVLGALLAMSAMALALVLLSMTETLASSNGARATAALYAAEAGIERALPDLVRAPDWDAVLGGQVRSGFTDGEAGGSRQLPDGSRISLDEVVNLANCGSPVACTAAAMDAVTTERPLGRNNPRWQLFGHGPLAALLPGPGVRPPPEYVVVLVADDTSENDDDPYRDGTGGASPGAGVIQLRAEAFGPLSAHRAIEVVVARGNAISRVRGYSAQRGEGTTGGPPLTDAVEVPGASITRSELSAGGGMTRQ